MENSAQKPEKDVAISCVRVYAMLFILVCHIIRYYTWIPGAEWLGNFFDIGVPVFLVISGYLYGRKMITDFWAFWRRRYMKICFPVVVWALILLLIGGTHNIWDIFICGVNLQGFRWIFTGSTIGLSDRGLTVSWFVTVIFLCYMMLPILQRVRERFSEKKVIVFLTIMWLASVALRFLGIDLYYVCLFSTGYFASGYQWIQKLTGRFLTIGGGRRMLRGGRAVGGTCMVRRDYVL